MDNDADPRGCDWGAVEVEMATNLCPSRQLWVGARATEQVESDFCLGQQTVPQVEWKIFVHTAQASNKMFLECANCALGRVATVVVRWHELKIDVLFMHFLFQDSGGFVVKSTEAGFETSIAQLGVQDLVAS